MPEPSAAGISCWETTACRAVDSCTAICRCWLGGNTSMIRSMVLARAGRMQRGEYQMPGLRRCHSDRDRLKITHLAQQDHIRTLPQRRPQSHHVTLRVGTDLALAHDALFMPVKVFQRILHGDDMFLLRLVDGVDDAGQRPWICRCRRDRSPEPDLLTDCPSRITCSGMPAPAGPEVRT